MSECLLQQARARKISSILSNGLFPADKLSRMGNLEVPSCDPNPHGVVCRTPIQPGSDFSDAETFNSRFDNLFYTGGTGGVFPVLRERKYDHSIRFLGQDLTAEHLSRYKERMWASFILLGQLDMTNWQSENSFIHPGTFLAAIFPQEIWDQYQQAGLPEPENLPQIIPVTGTVTGKILNFPTTIEVPDYESEVRSIARHSPSMLWMHAVRLHTMEDLQQVA